MAFCIHGRAKSFVHSFLSYLPKELNETSKKLVQSETSLEMQVKVLCFFFVLNISKFLAQGNDFPAF